MTAFILAVDDSSSMRMAVRAALVGAGYSVTEACDGLDALGKAAGQRFDLVITDLNMPNMDGLTLIRELRKSPLQSGVPIVFLTTESDEQFKAQARAAGATGWLVKPFNAEQLTRIARKVIGR